MTEIHQRLAALLEGQSEHPVYPVVELVDVRGMEATVKIGGVMESMPVEKVAEMRWQREKRIRLEKEDRFRYRCEPEMWKKIDLRMARKRLENPGVQLELLVIGGIRGSKTDFTHCRAALHFFYTAESWVWGLHETEASSNTIQQARIMQFFPPELNPVSGKMRKDKHTKLSYSEGSGFTGSMFNLKWQCHDENGNAFEGGGLFDFKFYKSADSSLQGAELSCAVSDELIPKATCMTVKERLLSRAADTRRPEFLARIRRAVEMLEAGEDLPGPLLAAIYHGVHLIGFTPKEGYSPTVQEFLDGAVMLEEVEADLLPLKNGRKQKVPRFKQPKKATRLAAWLHTYDNAHRGNWPGMVADCVGATEAYIRIIAYGDVSKGYAVRYPKFNDAVHVIQRAQIPRAGTWYHVVDPAGDRNWFMLWAVVDALGRVYIAREWPQEGDLIPDVGDPGPWAVTSEVGKRNGDAGPAQDGLGWGFARYKREIDRVEKELGEWWHGKDGEKGPPIKVSVRKMDSRLGAAPTPNAGGYTTIMDGMADEGLDFESASGDRLKEGDQAIQDALDYNDKLPIDALNAPHLYVNDCCRNIIFMFQNYGDPTKPKDEACKDPRDVVAYLLLDDPIFQEGVLEISGGGSF